MFLFHNYIQLRFYLRIIPLRQYSDDLTAKVICLSQKYISLSAPFQRYSSLLFSLEVFGL